MPDQKDFEINVNFPERMEKQYKNSVLTMLVLLVLLLNKNEYLQVADITDYINNNNKNAFEVAHPYTTLYKLEAAKCVKTDEPPNRFTRPRYKITEKGVKTFRELAARYGFLTDGTIHVLVKRKGGV